MNVNLSIFQLIICSTERLKEAVKFYSNQVWQEWNWSLFIHPCDSTATSQKSSGIIEDYIKKRLPQ